jgi:colanic acid biosynthesis glycosyl transferase WcaI
VSRPKSRASSDNYRNLRIVLHDYAGHPFQVQLSRELARRGYVVDHQYSSSHDGGRGRLQVSSEDDPASFSITDVALAGSFAKYSWGRRVRQEFEYALRAFVAIRRADPDVTVFCNVPLLANAIIAMLMRVARRPYVFWHQDVQSEAVRSSLAGRYGPVGRMLVVVAARLERQIAQGAGRCVAITPAFLPLYRNWGIPESAVKVISNWAPVDELPRLPQDRGWLGGRQINQHVLLYSGTLGLKHDPSALLDLATSPMLADCTVVVTSQGKGRAWLDERAGSTDPGRLVLLDYVDYVDLPGALCSADILLVLLESDASRYSVPSKVLTYMCAGRPIVGLMSSANAAAVTLAEEAVGLVENPGDHDRLATQVRRLIDDPQRAREMGDRARRYAEITFDVGRIADDFEELLEMSVSVSPASPNGRRRDPVVVAKPSRHRPRCGTR